MLLNHVLGVDHWIMTIPGRRIAQIMGEARLQVLEQFSSASDAGQVLESLYSIKIVRAKPKTMLPQDGQDLLC